MRFILATTTLLAALLLMPDVLRAQVNPPFFNGGGVAYDPEISVVNSGAILDAQVAVSPDRKYVTLTARPQNSSLLALQTFNLARGQALGFVGDAPARPAIQSSPAAIERNARNILTRPGVHRVG